MLKAFFNSNNRNKDQTQDPKQSSSSSASAQASEVSSSSSTPTLPTRTSSSIMSTWAVPPFPHPLPERRIGLVATQDGLLVFPKSSLQKHNQSNASATQHLKSTTSYSTPAAAKAFGSGDGFKVASLGHSGAATIVGSPSTAATGRINFSSLDVAFLIKWSKEARLEPLQPSVWRPLLESYPADQQMECDGIVGISKMFSSSYLFVITSSKLVGTYFHTSRPIYCCTGVVAIPLLKPEAEQAIKSQIAKQPSPVAPSQSKPTSTASSDEDSDDDNDDDDDDDDDSDFDDVQTPAAIPKEPFFSDLSAYRSETLRMPKSRPWLTKAARAVSEGRIQTVSEDPDSLAEVASAHDPESQVVDLPKPPSPKKESEPTHTLSPVSPEDKWHAAKQAELEEKAVRETAKHFARGEFWFSYDFDLTTSLQKKNDALRRASSAGSSAANPQPPSDAKKGHSTSLSTSSIASTSSNGSSAAAKAQDFMLLDEPYANLPLWRRADRRFWHNEHMCKDLIHAGLHAYILPVMQGYLQTVDLPITSTGVPDDTQNSEAGTNIESVERCQMMVISRRSKERAGLRYQRRGINEAGQVANYVETEQIVYLLRQSPTGGRIGDVLSFVQFRGSIPLYWSQSPFSLKPPPVLERGPDENLNACRKHFAAQVERYGTVTCINLAEQGGKEGQISEAYRTTVQKLVDENLPVEQGKGSAGWNKNIQYIDFDFHKECSGMKFENVSKLTVQMQSTLGEMQYFHQTITVPPSGAGSLPTSNEVKLRQKGAFRVSCLDCLDRTNVVQSAFARHVLTHQLGTVGVRVGNPDTNAAPVASAAT